MGLNERVVVVTKELIDDCFAADITVLMILRNEAFSRQLSRVVHSEELVNFLLAMSDD